MTLIIHCADIGSVKSGNFGWARLSVDPTPSACNTGFDIQSFADAIAADINAGHRVALGFECPLFVPVSDDPKDLTSARPGEGNRAWSAGAGAGSLATGLTETVWILDRVRRQLFEEEFELDDPVELLEPLSFLLARLLNDLCARLTARALATSEIRLTLALENASPHQCTLRLPVPMADPKTLLKLLQLELSARSPGAPVLKLRIELNPVKLRIQQHGLFIARAPEPAKLEVTLSRLSNLMGPDNVGAPQLLDTHRPDSFRMARFSAATYKTDASPCPFEVLTLRRYRPPQIAQVRLVDEAPAHIATAIFRSKVIACAGPWRSSGDWWKEDPWDHSEWDIAVTGGALYRVHEDLRRGRWFLEGNYD